MIIFNKEKYELFFSNKLAPLIALNYADELFFEEFEKLCNGRYRILSIIRDGWQQKYGLGSDIKKLKQLFEGKIDNNSWADNLLAMYDSRSDELKNLLDNISTKDYSESTDQELIKDIKEVREKSAVLDAMSNMLHLFSSLIGYQFFEIINKYSDDKGRINQNFIFYTQPIRESRFAKINIPELDNKFELSEHDMKFSKILRIGAFVKDDVSELLDIRKDLMKDLFVNIAKRIGCSSDDLEYLQIAEIEDFLLKTGDPSELIEKRRKITVLFYPDNNLQIYEGDEAENLIKDLKEIVEEKNVKELHGQTASLGTVKGKVIVALTSEEAMQKIQEGDILIAPYTAVEYLPAMKKAAAIIIETGGITSHAAIVSREFNIPCVIGVQNATKILKDGQEVEVNADEGIIKIL